MPASVPALNFQPAAGEEDLKSKRSFGKKLSSSINSSFKVIASCTTSSGLTRSL
jgi:hypothetical protein